MADDFVDNVASFSSTLAKHRNSKVLEVKDVSLHLAKNWNMVIPGFGSDVQQQQLKGAGGRKHRQVLDQHRKRLAVLRKRQMEQEGDGPKKKRTKRASKAPE
jgi:transcription initiation factor TFIID subunit 12